MKLARKALTVACLVAFAVLFAHRPQGAKERHEEETAHVRPSDPARQVKSSIASEGHQAGPRISEAKTDTAVRAVISDFAQQIERSLTDLPQYAEYVSHCRQLTDECRKQYTDLLHYAIAVSGIRELLRAGHAPVDKLVTSFGRESVQQALGRNVGSSSSTFERVAGLLVLKHADVLQPIRPSLLDSRAYANLAQKPLVEGEILAGFHRREGVGSFNVAREFLKLGQEVDDTRARRASLIALGHAETAEVLQQASSTMSGQRDNWADLAMATMNCGLACGSTVASLMHSGQREIRIAVYETLAFAPALDRRALADLILRNSPADLDSQELAQRSDFLQTINSPD